MASNPEHPIFRRSSVRSTLARTETKKTSETTAQCTATRKQTVKGFPHYGETLRCDRPANRHRLHDHGGWFQW